MIRIIAKLFAVILALTTFLHVAPLFAAPVTAPVTYISSTGSDANSCTAALPCATFSGALAHTEIGGQVNCLNSPSDVDFIVLLSVTTDCTGLYGSLARSPGLLLAGINQVWKIRNLTMSGTAGGFPAIRVSGSGTLILENCVFENFTGGSALEIQPAGAFNLVITNSRISNNIAGVLIKPAVGGSVTATFDGVTIADNKAGGVKTDTTSGPVRLDISNSTISINSGNGLNAVGGAGGANMLNIRNSVIASNGSAGIQANGATAAALVNNTLLDSNAAGATSVVNSGRVLTYGNNSIVGTAGSGFTGTTPLQ